MTNPSNPMVNGKTLYKVSSTGKMLIWTITAYEGTTISNRPTGCVEVCHGQIGGKIQKKTEVIQNGKNIGKANETTAFEQAVLEAESKYRKQLDKGYLPTQHEAVKLVLNNSLVRPMLAHRYDQHADKIAFPCFAQHKLDGVRCLSYLEDGKLVMKSRKGKEFKALGHISAILNKLLVEMGVTDLIFDGELYRHDEDFETLISLIKRDKPHADSHKIQLHIYDLTSSDINVQMAVTMEERVKMLAELEQLVIDGGYGDVIKIVKTFTVKDQNEIDILMKYSLLEGYEGLILRNKDGIYQFEKRSYDLLKVKEFIDDEFQIADVIDGKGTHDGLATFICLMPAGYTFKCTPQGSEGLRGEFFENKQNYIGKWLTVKYFGLSKTKQPKPRFPSGLRIRDTEL